MSSCCRRIVPLLVLAVSSIQAQLVDPDFLNRPWINEFHYDNRGTDVNEFVEIAAPEGLDISSYQLILYNGFYGFMYEEDAFHPLTTFTKGATVNGVDFYYLRVRPQDCSSGSSWCGLQNGKDGFALANYFTATSGRVVEFISYEGTFMAKDGPATNMTSNDIGVEQRTLTPKGHSISRIGPGCKPNDFVWANVDEATMGTVNYDQTITCAVAFINEFHYDNANDPVGQFVEVASNVEDVSTYSVVLYGQDGLPYDALLLSSFVAGDTTDDGLTFYYYDFPSMSVGMEVGDSEMVNGTETTTAAGMALVNNDETVLEFISYGGLITAVGGAAEGMTSVDIGVSETDETPIGSSLQLTGEGCSSLDFEWTAVESSQVDLITSGETRGQVNSGQTIVCVAELINVTDTEAPEPEVDDLLAEDDDFLDDDAVVVFNTESTAVSRTYTEGKRPTEPIDRKN